MNEILIEDICVPVAVPDNSLTIFIICVILLIGLLFFIYYFYKKRVKKKEEERYLDILLKSDFYNVKQSAYLFTYYARKLAKTQEQKKRVEQIISQLFLYKYQKKSLQIPQSLQEEIQNFLNLLRDFYA